MKTDRYPEHTRVTDVERLLRLPPEEIPEHVSLKIYEYQRKEDICRRIEVSEYSYSDADQCEMSIRQETSG